VCEGLKEGEAHTCKKGGDINDRCVRVGWRRGGHTLSERLIYSRALERIIIPVISVWAVGAAPRRGTRAGEGRCTRVYSLSLIGVIHVPPVELLKTSLGAGEGESGDKIHAEIRKQDCLEMKEI